MIRLLALIIALALSGIHTSRGEGRSWQIPMALETVDLASDTAWTLSIDDKAPRPIKVPAGGYNSDRQDKPWISMCVETGYSVDRSGVRDVDDHVMYQRVIRIPKVREDQVTLLEFGAVNHGAEVFLVDGQAEKLVATHVGPLMPFSADLTKFVTPGKEYTLKVKSYPLWHYTNAVPHGFIYLESWLNDVPGQWNSRFGFGITKYVRLAIYPQLRINDVFVKTSVERDTMLADVAVRNDSDTDKTLNLSGELTSWNGDSWKYPAIPTKEFTVPAHKEIRVPLGPIPWGLGSNSYWWPNKPYRDDYKAQLHLLSLKLCEGKTELYKRVQRFGFVQWEEKPGYYTVNGVRINFIADSTPESGMSEYDCYTTAPAFLPPSGKIGGCPETWRRHMRMGISVIRTHQSAPTEYMMDTADELGFMLIPETPIRGCQRQYWHNVYLPQSGVELAMVCRAHPSVCRYSVFNEAAPEWVPPMVDAFTSVDDTRPLVFEDNQMNHPGSIAGTNGHAYAMLHYVLHPRPATMLTGVGEIAWANWGNMGDGPEVLGFLSFDGRCQDVVYYCGWDWINYWPNFLEEMNAKRHCWKQIQSWHDDRVDNVDGWNSPLINWVQRCFHPYLTADRNFMLANGPYNNEWPRKLPAYHSGQTIKREFIMFNDSLKLGVFDLHWALRWDSPQGEILTNGVCSGVAIRPGYHVTKAIELTAPEVTAKRKLCVVLESIKDGTSVFRTEDAALAIAAPNDDFESKTNRDESPKAPAK